MNHITYRISLDLRKTDSGVVVKVKRDDTVKKLAISLTDGGKPYHITEDCSAKFAGEKPDGTILCNPCSIEDCVVTYEITPQTIAELGEVKSEIRLYSTDGDLATSPSFTILVVPPVYDDDRVIESRDEVNALTELITSAAGTIQRGENVVQQGNVIFAGLQDKEEELDQYVEILSQVPTKYVSLEEQETTDVQKQQARTNINAADASAVVTSIDGKMPSAGNISLGAVSYLDQALSAQERETARKNIDAVSAREHAALKETAQATAQELDRVAAVVEDVVLTTGQELTEDQKASARQNIGAASAGDVESVQNKAAESVLFTAQVLTEKQKAEARSNIDAAGGSEVVKTYQQVLTHQQMDTARYNINAASVDQFNALADTVNNMDADVADLTNTAVRKDSEASVSSIKILHSPETSDAIFAEGTTVSDKDDLLVNALTLRGDFEGEIDLSSVILRNVHAGEEPADAVNLAQLNEAVGKQKVYEHIATITVVPDADGSLPQHVIFSTDSESNPFKLTDFIVQARAGFVDGSKSGLYMTVNNNKLVMGNSAVSGISATPRSFTIFYRQENDGSVRAEHTVSGSSASFYNPANAINESRVVAPEVMTGFAGKTVTKIDLYTMTGDTKAWVEGSKFELWGVRV